MSDSPIAEDGAFKLMQDRLVGAENDTKNLAKMLLDLGISPSITPDDNLGHTSPFSGLLSAIEFSKHPLDDNDKKQGEKLVRFAEGFDKQELKSPQPIHKKSTIKPLQVNINSLNQAKSNLKGSVSSDQYSKLISRLCKTESVIQSLKLNMCAAKTSREANDREKNLVIDKLKQEINEQDVLIKKQNEEFLEEQRRREDHTLRWKEAESEVKKLHERLQLQTTMSKENSSEIDGLREKYSRKLEEAKQEAAREKEVRVAIEDSHASLLSRIQDMESEIQLEMKQTDSLRDENMILKGENEHLRMETTRFHQKAKDLEETLFSLKEEINAKEIAIRRLIEEQHQNQESNLSLDAQQTALHKELKQCNIVLEVQKAAFSRLEDENLKLKEQLDFAERNFEEKERQETKKQEEETIRESEEQMKRKILEGRLKEEMNQAVKAEKKRYKELEERNRLLEQCLKEQERVMKEKEQEYSEREKEQDENFFEEKKRTARAVKEKEQAVKAREALLKDLNRANTDVSRDKEFLQQQLEELKLEQEVIMKERSQLEEENHRLMNRVASVEQQEQAYKKAQDLAHASNTAKSQLSYENGKLQMRVEQLEEELRTVATVQSQVVQLRATNRALEQKYSQLTSELATSRVDSQRTSTHVKQLQSGMSRKEADFHLAIAARDEAVRDKEAALAQMNAIKEQERNKLALLKRDMTDCKSDNDRLISVMHEMTSRQAELQDALNQAQAQLGRKDTQITALSEERLKLDHDVNELRSTVARLQHSINGRDADEQARISPALDALERAREENVRLSGSLEEVLKKNEKLQESLDKHKTDLEIQRERVDMLVRQQEDNEKDRAVTAQTHADRLQQMKDQFARERSAIRKQLQVQISELKKSQESSQIRNSQLTKGNTELRSKLADREQGMAKLKEKLKQQKSVIDRHQRERKSHVDTEQKLKAIDDELVDLERSKQAYAEKNKQQSGVISTFNREIASLKNDITALSEAHAVAREANTRFEAEIAKGKAEKRVLSEKLQTMERAMKLAIHEKRNAEDKLRRVEIESVQVQENLQEAQTWFTDKFEKLQNELTRKGNQKT